MISYLFAQFGVWSLEVYNVFEEKEIQFISGDSIPTLCIAEHALEKH